MGKLTVPLGLLGIVPVAVGLRYWLHASAVVVFIASGLAVAVVADWIRRSTDQLAAHVGPTIGGLLNVSFGSLGELILAIFVLMRGEQEIVRAQIVGSIIGTTLLGLGLAALVGGLRRETQRFGRERAGLLSSLLSLAVVALLLPAAFDVARRITGDTQALRLSEDDLSLGTSAVLLLLYAGNLVYTLITRRDVFVREEDGQKAEWSVAVSIGVLIAATVGVAIESEVFSDALTKAGPVLHLSPTFLGVVVLAVVGTASDLIAGVYFAWQGKIGLVMSINIGSAVQMSLAVAPLLVIISWLLGNPMSLVFGNPLELFAIAGAVYIVNAIAGDAETTWFEGLMLVGVYVLFALAFYFFKSSDVCAAAAAGCKG